MTNKTTNIIAWTLQILLGAMFLMTGVMKSIQPLDQLATSLPWVKDASVAFVRFIGVAELLAGLGLILPSVLKYKTFLTPLAALGVVLIMIGATVFHISRGETGVIGMNIIIAALAIYVAWARYKKAPIYDRSLGLR
jgi:uncharacterized membrane protein YphA (DoxX/SURF4 family)